MNFAIAPVEATSTPSRFSHRLARGLRRELFREFHDRDREWETLPHDLPGDDGQACDSGTRKKPAPSGTTHA